MKEFFKNYFVASNYFDAKHPFGNTTYRLILWLFFTYLFVSSFIEQWGKYNVKDYAAIPVALFFILIEFQPAVKAWRETRKSLDKILDHVCWVLIISYLSILFFV